MEKNMQEPEGQMMDTELLVTQPVGIGYGKIEAPDLKDEEATELCKTVTEQYIVAVQKNAPSCCIDGRGCVHRLDGSSAEPGPKVAGGALVTAYAAAEIIGWFEENDSRSREERLKLVNATLAQAGVITGGHCDTKASSAQFNAGGTGCGANDKLPEIITNIAQNPEITLVGTELLVSKELYSQEATESVIAQSADTKITDWVATDMITVLKSDTPAKIEVLANDNSETGGHYEVIVFKNPNPDTTVDRDGLLQEMNVQAFVIDTWYIDKLARAMARGPEAEAQYSQLKHAMMAYQVGTLITLGNGTHRIAELGQVAA